MNEPYRAKRAHEAALRKVDREHIATMHVIAKACPHSLMRVLGLIAQHGRVPFFICAERQPPGQHFRVEIEALPDMAATALLEKITADMSVRRAVWLECANTQPNLDA